MHGVAFVTAGGRGCPAEEIPQQGEQRRPQHGTDRRPGEEPPPLHPAHAGDDGDVGPHDRHEAPEHERLVAILVEELVRLVEVLLLGEAPVAPLEGRPDRAPDLVADDVAREGEGRQQHAGHEDVHGDAGLAAVVHLDEHPDGKEQ